LKNQPLAGSDEVDNEPLPDLSTDETEFVANFELHLLSCI